MAYAEQAREAEACGQFRDALNLFRKAIETFNPEEAPVGEDGEPEMSWPAIWEGCCITLSQILRWRETVHIIDRLHMRTLKEVLVYLFKLHRAWLVDVLYPRVVD
jgi:hypothetical protein